jgi:hypothetical protein
MTLVRTILAHGGLAGLVVEGLVAALVLGLFVAVWARERRSRRSRARDGDV